MKIIRTAIRQSCKLKLQYSVVGRQSKSANSFEKSAVPNEFNGFLRFPSLAHHSSLAVSSLELYRKRSSLSLSKTYQQKSRIGRTCSERSESGKIGIENSIH